MAAPNRATTLLTLGLLLIGAAAAARAVTPPDPEAERRPSPPRSRVEHHDPDQTTCRPDNLLRGYRQQLKAFADQPPEVQARLQRLQRDLAVGSLNNCIRRGLLSREQARQLAASMGIDRDGTAPAAPVQPAPSQRP